MGNQPIGVSGVTGEPSGNLVVNAAPSHFFQGQVNHLQGSVVVAVPVVAEQHLKVHCLGELGRGAGPPVLIVKVGGQSGIGLVQGVHRYRGITLGHLAGPPHLGGNLIGHPVNFFAAVVIGIRHRLQQSREAGHVESVHRGKVCAAVKWTSIRGEKHGHGPAAAAG